MKLIKGIWEFLKGILICLCLIVVMVYTILDIISMGALSGLIKRLKSNASKAAGEQIKTYQKRI